MNRLILLNSERVNCPPSKTSFCFVLVPTPMKEWVEAEKREWRSTGLYAAAGEIVEFQIHNIDAIGNIQVFDHPSIL